MTQPEYSTILCSCNFTEHLLILHFNKDDKEIYLEYHLCSPILETSNNRY